MAQPPPQPPRYLFTKDNTPATYSTKWEDLHPDSQKVMLEIEESILECRDESQRIDQCSRLRDSSISNKQFELDASNILQELYGITIDMDRQKVTLKERMAATKDMLRNTDVAVRSFIMLQPGYLQPGFYRGTPEKPSPFLQQTVARFEKLLSECRQLTEELEPLLHSDYRTHSSGSSSSQLESLPGVLDNVHGFFVHVAAKVGNIYDCIESMRTAYIADLRRQGFQNNPFLEADTRETARQESAAQRVHQTMHLPSVPQQVGGTTAQLALPAAQMIHPTMHLSPVPQPTGQASGRLALPARTGFSSWYASPSAFGFSTTPAASSTPSHFSTPTSSAPFQSSSSSPSAFGFSTAPAASSTPSQFSTPTDSAPLPSSSSSPSAFGFSTAPAASSTPSQFSTPIGSAPFPSSSSSPSAFGFSTAPAASSTPSLFSTPTGSAPLPSSPFSSLSASLPASGVSTPAAAAAAAASSSMPSKLSTTFISTPRQIERFLVWDEKISSASGVSTTAASSSSQSSFSTPTSSAPLRSSRFTISASSSSTLGTSTPAAASSAPSPLSRFSSSRSRSLPAPGTSTISHYSTEAATGTGSSSGTPPRASKRDGSPPRLPNPKHRLPR